jgi:fructokinase
MTAPNTVVTSGFVAVDIILDDTVRASTGGTATNVARALATLGWNSAVVGTIGNDPAGNFAHDQLESLGIDTSNLIRSPLWTTPVVLQEGHRGDHIWRFSCPVCHARFAKHRPSPEDFANRVVASIGAPTVFLFDRVSRFTLALAEAWSEEGTLIVFEPATLGHERLFDRAAATADVTKFSSERAAAFEERLAEASGALVETLGSAGARVKQSKSGDWESLEPIPVVDLVDSAGAGDWTTAGMIDDWIRNGRTPEGLVDSVNVGQALGAQACGWESVHPAGPQEIGTDFESFACPRVATSNRVPHDVSSLAGWSPNPSSCSLPE